MASCTQIDIFNVTDINQDSFLPQFFINVNNYLDVCEMPTDDQV